MAGPQGIALDGQLGPGDAERREDRLRIRLDFPRWNRLLHLAEDDPGAFACQLDGHDARIGFDPDHELRERPAEHERGAERRMAGERQLPSRREDPDPHVGVVR